MARYCIVCGCALPLADPAYVKYCKSCYRRLKQAENEEMQHELDALRHENQRLRQKASPPALDDGTLRLLLQLCHPDRHAGSAAANKATRWLLGQKNRP